MDQISCIIKANSNNNLRNWKDSIKTRSGAASWIKRRLALLAPVVLPLFSSAHVSFADASRHFATQLASRWNIGCHSIDLHMANLSSICSPHATMNLQSCPPARVSHALPGGPYFADIPAAPKVSPWLPGEVMCFASKGSCGLDGWDCKSLCKLDEESLDFLCALYNEANKGRFPKFWHDAKVTGIPKKGSTEYRPLTILSTTYRVWARRQAYMLGPWFDAWAPRGMFGGRVKIGASDAASLVSMRCERARLGLDGPLHLASTDMEKYFDRLLLPTLHQLSVMAKLPPGILAVLDLYANLRRQVFLDGSPTPFVLTGTASCGVPQGCPLACLFTNIASAALIEYVSQVPGVEVYTYLDDRVFFATSHRQLELALARAQVFDLACGCTCNNNKSFYVSYRCRPLRLGPILSSMQRARSSFPYLGIDILVSGHGNRKLAKQRVDAFLQRCSLVSRLPASQRTFCTGDAVASLWLSAGSLYTSSEFSKMISASASALRAHTTKDSRVMLRSRAVEHLAGARFHRTYPPAAAMYDSLKQLNRLFRLGRLDVPSWTQLWQHRDRAAATHLVTFRRCRNFLDFSWSSSTAVKCGLCSYSIQHAHHMHIEWHTHLLRDFVRTSAWSSEAKRRPKDFSGAERGIDMELARSIYSKPYGPSLVTAGSWTALRLYIADKLPTPLCVRCLACPDSKEHRLWWCDDNAEARSQLFTAHPSLRVDLLPPCLRRCALVPRTFDGTVGSDVANFLLSTSSRATAALAAAHKEGVT